MTKVFLNKLGMVNPLGYDLADVFTKLVAGDTSYMQPHVSKKFGKHFMVGKVQSPLPKLPETFVQHNSRNNQLLLKALQPLESDIMNAINTFGSHRIGVVLGTSTSGIDQGEKALDYFLQYQGFPDDYDYHQQELGDPAEFVAQYFNLNGPVYVISTACSSSGKVMASARSLIQNDICDLVITGGVDSLCEMTLNGFASLEATSEDLTNPFSKNRQGINIGEGAAVFLMSKNPIGVELLAVGESSDAHHMSAPQPEGLGAIEAMQSAIDEAKISARDIDYLNLHGTGTPLNDAMESHATYEILGNQTPCSSTKPLIGHTLGAAGANELAFCWLLLSDLNKDQQLAPHVYDKQADPTLSDIALVKKSQYANKLEISMSNSFAFGGSNVSVILGKI